MLWRAVACAVVVTLVVAACGAAESEETAGPAASPSPAAAAPTPSPAPTADLAENARLALHGGVLVLANRSDPPAAFDPMRTSSIALHHPGGGLFGPGNLVFRCRENIYLVCPGLASDWTVSPDFTEWTFTLRGDAAWHDGEPFTGDDVAFWFELAALGIDDERGVRAPAYFRGDLGLATREAPGVEVLRPERDWEGADAPLEPSVRSTAYGHVNQLRDPAIFEDAASGRIYLLYAVAGESGIAIAELHLDG